MQRTMCVLVLPLAAAGCTQTAFQTVSVSYQRQRLRTTDYHAVFDAAERAVRESFRIAERDRDAGIIRGEQRYADVRPDGLRVISESVGAPLRARKVAEVRLRRHDSDIEVLCRVFVQENTTDAVRMLTREHGVYDQPYDTPADREAGTTRAQNTVWRNRRRDRSTERQLMASIREIVEKSATQPETR